MKEMTGEEREADRLKYQETLSALLHVLANIRQVRSRLHELRYSDRVHNIDADDHKVLDSQVDHIVDKLQELLGQTMHHASSEGHTLALPAPK